MEGETGDPIGAACGQWGRKPQCVERLAGTLALHVPGAQGFRPASCLTARGDARPPS
ncbi:MAG: hypothetical protein FWG50_08555 [Kiritimatiellaeota bacterium]|nr:hypothetical protein [Kiritimatiellota bacterium]